eukprot:1176991-Prorocentrum_minimum.AAC.11
MKQVAPPITPPHAAFRAERYPRRRDAGGIPHRYGGKYGTYGKNTAHTVKIRVECGGHGTNAVTIRVAEWRPPRVVGSVVNEPQGDMPLSVLKGFYRGAYDRLSAINSKLLLWMSDSWRAGALAGFGFIPQVGNPPPEKPPE